MQIECCCCGSPGLLPVGTVLAWPIRLGMVIFPSRDACMHLEVDEYRGHTLMATCCGCRGNFLQFEEMYDQRRTEVNKAADKFEKQMKAAKRSGNKANQDKVNKNMKQSQSRKVKSRGQQTADDEGAAEAAAAPKRWTDYTVSDMQSLIFSIHNARIISEYQPSFCCPTLVHCSPNAFLCWHGIYLLNGMSD